MKLYYSPGACSMAAHILFHEYSITHTLEKVDLKAHKTEKGEDFYKINPKGYVPFLVLDDGKTLSENIAILSYLGEVKGQAPADRYKFLECLAFISTELHKSIGSLFGFKDGKPEEVVKMIKDRIAARLKFVDQHLASQENIFGSSFSPADAYLVTVLNWCPMLNVDLSPYSNINNYLGKMKARPSVQKAMKHEGLIK
jgi:glutathione S-transferase